MSLYSDGYHEGEVDTLRLVYIGAACAEQFYGRLSDREVRFYDSDDTWVHAEDAAMDAALAALARLAQLGVEVDHAR